ncbi:hypothetical protein [Lentilactobacillus farraginis]|uniref:Uncharacterized protein n=1 Tax=Lentilactobacillus farraginis DSM 18382 = JCM 14108 TaxID=1423743 RepID=X0PK72_9LACO|nr:hypothetical protein [Lentilactobacillus farraginis]KRM05495.1 hypothetical protein FD41_GL000727 [Lentilactobacillus farraginis DSM 18382 = JCM 14108]GAF37692.1 hypothetical protein JCM14108_2748 [Lentilactobacillus farraginis DSM 18382 = JCM 14108]
MKKVVYPVTITLFFLAWFFLEYEKDYLPWILVMIIRFIFIYVVVKKASDYVEHKGS